MSQKQVQSPSYPSIGLSEAIGAVAKIEKPYRSSPVDRLSAAKLIGFSGSTGPANMALAALASYGLVERAGKGMMRVTPLARQILHPASDDERAEGIRAAASSPRLYQEIRDHFPDLPVPPESGVEAYLNRRAFNPSAVGTAARAFLRTAKWVEEVAASERNGVPNDPAPSSSPGASPNGVSIGDFVQWERQGVRQFETPRRVRWVSDDGSTIAVEGSDGGIPMEQAILEPMARSLAPSVTPPPEAKEVPRVEAGFTEWFRAKVGADKLVTINFKGEGGIGPREIEKMIKVLEAQKLALED